MAPGWWLVFGGILAGTSLMAALNALMNKQKAEAYLWGAVTGGLLGTMLIALT